MTLPPDQSTMKPRKSARQARSAETVGVIVEAAARILEKDGHAGFTTNAVAERAGVSVGSLYQYFPNKDAITRALIRRELETLEAAILAIGLLQDASVRLTKLVALAVAQQLDRADLTRMLEVEEERLGAGVDIAPVRERVAVALASILGTEGHTVSHDVVQDVMMLIATLVNAAEARGERDADRLHTRVEAVVRARLEAC